jgi:hypothetical protein
MRVRVRLDFDILIESFIQSEGLIDSCELVFLNKSKDGDYHQEMNSVVFLEWFENQLMPALQNPSLVVLDNASYHNVKTEDTHPCTRYHTLLP